MVWWTSSDNDGFRAVPMQERRASIGATVSYLGKRVRGGAMALTTLQNRGADTARAAEMDVIIDL